jgi:branched-chain amino acid transport system ATP-binding protein
MELSRSNPELLLVEQLHVSYGRIVALRGVSLRVVPGEIVALLGANGAGKSTLLKTIMGLMRPTEGRIVFDGGDLTGCRTEAIAKRGIGLVPEGRRLFFELTVAENLRLGAFTTRDAERVRSSYERVYGLFPVLKERSQAAAGTLSGGMQQMLLIGRALMSSPRLLLLDEPSLGLAPQMVDRIFELIGRLPAEGVTVLLVEQTIEGALDLADRAYVLQSGEAVLSGTSEELRAADDLRHAYLGTASLGAPQGFQPTH